MIKRFTVIVALLAAFAVEAQENVSSPYSYYGIGLTNFKGTVENRSMGGLSMFADSIHVNLRNPAAYGRLRLTNYSVGASHERVSLKTNDASDNTTITSLDYLALGIPLGKGFGIGVGLIPYTSVGYRILDIEEETASQLNGRGGMNKVFLSAGYEFNKHWSIGIDANYNFGNFQNKRTVLRRDIQFGTRDLNRSDIRGFNFNLGANYKGQLTEKLRFEASATFAPEMDLNSDNFRQVSTIILSNGRELQVDQREIDVSDTQFTLPAKYSIGAGIGEFNKWFVGAEYSSLGSSSYEGSFDFRNDGGGYEDASQFKVGGFYIPNYNSVSSYLDRVVYRAGFRYDGTGLVINNESIKEFGISFGLGLPVGSTFSNANLGLELGRRGTKDSGLIQENFLRVSIGLSLNDKWFTRRKFN